ncbi:MAG: MmcQ/YjbR family DNA-binding protein [Gordonia sp. (in: high G+C Gram-positive bacteria)]
MSRSRTARVSDVHDLATSMPYVTVHAGAAGTPVFRVGGKAFVAFRTPRPDARDPATGEPYDDVIVFWVDDEATKTVLAEDESTPFFTTPHFAGHASILLRGSRIAELSLAELTEVVQDAWLSRASAARRRAWLSEHDLPTA